ncbi:MAG: hypothetical protein F4Y26_19935 [Gammaproteobacteria bacterium]|nr:hypothetical protein [Gammaproteobacteria bacterium]
MTTEVREILNASVVLLGADVLSNESEAVAFCNEWEAVHERTMAISETSASPARRFVVPSSRLELTVGEDGRTQAKVDYPSSREGAVEKVCDLVQSAQSLTQAPVSATSYGCNVALTYEQTSGLPAFQYLGRALFPSVDDSRNLDEVVGGSSKITFRCADGRDLAVVLEPRRNDQGTTRVFLSANYHIEEGSEPLAIEAMRTAMEDMWTHVDAVIGWLDHRGNVA